MAWSGQMINNHYVGRGNNNKIMYGIADPLFLFLNLEIILYYRYKSLNTNLYDFLASDQGSQDRTIWFWIQN